MFDLPNQMLVAIMYLVSFCILISAPRNDTKSEKRQIHEFGVLSRNSFIINHKNQHHT